MVIWSDPAKADLRSIHDFIAHDSPHYAKKVAQDISAKTDTLEEHPRLGRVVPELGNEAIRELSWDACFRADQTAYILENSGRESN
jgi:plasmid stabilization system protein ParE